MALASMPQSFLSYAPLALLLLSACATSPRPVSDEQPVSGWPLAKPEALDGAHEVRQILRGAFQSHEITLQCAVNATREKITAVGLTSLGLRAFTVKYDGRQVEAERAPQVPEFFKPEQLLNDLQLVFWPLRALETAFAGSGWRVTEPYAGTRRLRYNERLVAEVHYADPDPWNGRLWVVHFDVPYTLGLETHSVGDR